MSTDISLAVKTLRSKTDAVQTGIILGSGLGAAAQTVADAGGLVVPYADLPGMPTTRVIGHQGRLVIGQGKFAGVILLQGRVHAYEGHLISSLTFAARMLAELGMKTLIISNAAGGIQDGYRPGDLMLINGHWTLCDVQERNERVSGTDGRPTVTGHNRSCLRTAASSFLWSPRLLQLARTLSSSLTIHEGCYAMMSGPNYETPAEIQMLRTLGCQAVGMSTIPEALAAANRSIEVLGVSCITNIAAGLSDQTLDHAEVSETAASIESEFMDWLFQLIQKIREQPGSF